MPRTAPALPDVLTRQFYNNQKFTASGTFTVPAGVETVWVSLWGGGSTNNQSTAQTGGTGGWGVVRRRVVVTPGQDVTVTIGAAGATGGNSLFGSAGGGGVNAPAGDINAIVTAQGGEPGSTVSGVAAGDAWRFPVVEHPSPPVPGLLSPGYHKGLSGAGAGGYGAVYGRHGQGGYCLVEW